MEQRDKKCGQFENFRKQEEEKKRLESHVEKLQLIIAVSPGMMTKDPWGSIATRQALRMLGVSAAEMPHILHVSLRRLLRD